MDVRFLCRNSCNLLVNMVGVKKEKDRMTHTSTSAIEKEYDELHLEMVNVFKGNVLWMHDRIKASMQMHGLDYTNKTFVCAFMRVAIETSKI